METDQQLEKPAAPAEEGAQMTFFEHLVELRTRLIHSLIAIAVGAFIGVYVAKYIIVFVTQPMLKALSVVGFFLSRFGLVPSIFRGTKIRSALLIISIVAAIITPSPAAMTMQIFMAPMVGLYFVGIAVSPLVTRKRERRLAASPGPA